MPKCDHCLIEFPERDAVHDEIRGEARVFCCHGCQGVYRLIHDEGLDDFYRKRAGWLPGPVLEQTIDLAAFTGSVRTVEKELCETDIMLDGIRCASCVWLNEKVLERTPGIFYARVNYATHRARIRWDPATTGLAAVLGRITSIGYTPKPFSERAYEEEQRKLSRDLLIRFGTAAFFSMQLMLFSAALYAGYFQGIDPALRSQFQWISLAMTTPVLFYSGWPFFASALRGLRHGAFTMDVLIVAGAGSAYIYSMFQMAAGGEVYFDTSAMIVTLILLGRYIESGAKRKASESLTRLLSLSPPGARLLEAGPDGSIAAAHRRMTTIGSVKPGDLVEILPGEQVPLDGIVADGASEVDESMLTGESLPVQKTPGAEVFGGTRNLMGRIVFEVTRTGDETVLSRIVRAVEDAQARRAPVQAAADRFVGLFVPLLILSAVATAGFWLFRGSGLSAAVMHAVSVLVIACPCALGLATPLAILVGTTYGVSRGILIKGGDVIERAKDIDTVVFDKTGTITEGRPLLVYARGIGIDDARAIRLAASLERYSEHTIGKAIVEGAKSEELFAVQDFSAAPGAGVRGIVEGSMVKVGTREFVKIGRGEEYGQGDKETRRQGEKDRRGDTETRGHGVQDGQGDNATKGQGEKGQELEGLREGERAGTTVVYLSMDGMLAGVFGISDPARQDASGVVKTLESTGMHIAMITGDAQGTAEAVAERVGITSVMGRRTPVEKAEELQALRSRGRHTIMVGDGINDAPALIEADVGIAVGKATDIALESADIVLLRNDLRLVPLSIALAKKTYAVIRQNLFWAFFYNIVAIPLAVTGVLHPIVAAGAMALSSLSVVGNSLRARVK